MDIKIHYLAKAYDEPPPLSLVDPILTDNGVQGARLAIADNNKSGAFLGQKYELIEDLLPADGDVVAKDKEILSKGPALPPQEAGCGPAGRTRGLFPISRRAFRMPRREGLAGTIRLRGAAFMDCTPPILDGEQGESALPIVAQVQVDVTCAAFPAFALQIFVSNEKCNTARHAHRHPASSLGDGAAFQMMSRLSVG